MVPEHQPSRRNLDDTRDGESAPIAEIWRTRNPLGLPHPPRPRRHPPPPLRDLVTIDYWRPAVICANPPFLPAAYRGPITQISPAFMRVSSLLQRVDCKLVTRIRVPPPAPMLLKRARHGFHGFSRRSRRDELRGACQLLESTRESSWIQGLCLRGAGIQGRWGDAPRSRSRNWEQRGGHSTHARLVGDSTPPKTGRHPSFASPRSAAGGQPPLHPRRPFST